MHIARKNSKHNLHISFVLLALMSVINITGIVLLKLTAPFLFLPDIRTILFCNTVFCIVYLCCTEFETKLPVAWRWPLFRLIFWIPFMAVSFPWIPELSYFNIAVFCPSLIMLIRYLHHAFSISYFILGIFFNLILVSVIQATYFKLAAWLYYKIKTPPR